MLVFAFDCIDAISCFVDHSVAIVVHGFESSLFWANFKLAMLTMPRM